MNAIDVRHLSYRYRNVTALRDLDLHVPEGVLYALLGPNGSGKTTLMQVLMGLRRPSAGRATVLGSDSTKLTPDLRSRIGYVAEGQELPSAMRIGEVEAFLAPLYDTWDSALARRLRERFSLDPARRVRTLSRGERMKVALLCALAPRPRLLVMDEPFTGMDAVVKDDLVRGLLETSGSEGWTVFLCSHDIGELELLADWVGVLDRGTLRISQPLDQARERFRWVEVFLAGDAASRDAAAVPPEWLAVERSARGMTFVASGAEDGSVEAAVRNRLQGVQRVESREATLREIFVALAAPAQRRATLEEAA